MICCCSRDLKPENVMGGAESGYIKLIDFGTAKYYEQVATAGGSDSSLCAVQDAACDTYSTGYTSPEAMNTSADLDPFAGLIKVRSHNPFANDVHCLGVELTRVPTGLVSDPTCLSTVNSNPAISCS